MFPKGQEAIQILKELWSPAIWIFVAALMASLAATPFFRWVAVRQGICDRPDNAVKIHRGAVPYLGGCAIWLAWTAPMLLYTLRYCTATEWPALVALLAGGVVAFLTGLIDDLRDIKPWMKLLGQSVAAALLLAGGVQWLAYPIFNPDSPLSLSPDSWIVLAVSILMQFLVVIGASNATNLLDGLDGLCTGVTAIISLGFLLLSTALVAWARFGAAQGGQTYVHSEVIMVAALALAGAVIGFLPYNFNPARIFMGDAGSVFIGYVLAAMMIMFAGTYGVGKWFVGALFIFGVPIFDTGVAVIRRVLNGRRIMMPDRSHLYNQLIDRLGFSVRSTVGVLYGLSVIFGLAGLLVLYLPGRYALLLYFGVGAVFLIVVWRLGFLKMTEEEKAAADRYLEAKRRS